MKRNKGFTLIELLVVIAIIGILSAIVLASLNTARSKATDAKIQSQLSGMRSAAEIYYSTHGNYGATPNTVADYTAADTLPGIFGDASSGMSGLASSTISVANGGLIRAATSGTPASAWAVSAQLSTAGSYWCVDSTGKSVPESAALAGASCL